MARRLSGRSFEHSRRTAATAVKLAKIHNVDPEKANLAGWLHDVAKEYSPEALMELAAGYGLVVNEAERRKPYLLHAAVGAKMIEDDLGVRDEGVLAAIRKHTFGAAEMNDLDKIIYLADVAEPGRKFQGLDRIRELAKKRLDLAFAEAYRLQLIFIISNGGCLHPETISVWNRITSEVGKLEC